jgi:aminodeoxychorismate lyase
MSPIVYLNGQFVPQEQALVSVADRGLCYGDGLFETLPARNNQLIGWTAHLRRMQRGADFLKIPHVLDMRQLKQIAQELLRRNECSDAVLRVELTRGVGNRGYSTVGATRPTLFMTVHPMSQQANKKLSRWNLVMSSIRVLADDPLTQFKTISKLRQVMARQEAESQHADEALLLNHHGRVAEAASANIFVITPQAILTPPEAEGALPGITRAWVIRWLKRQGQTVKIRPIPLDELQQSRRAFLTSSVLGTIAVTSLDGQPFVTPKLVHELHGAYG